MKRICLLLTLMSLLQLSLAQRTVYHAEPEKLFNQGKEMFLEGNYAGAEDLLTRFSAMSDDVRLKEEAAYMQAVASFERGSEDSSEQLETFLNNHPESVHRHPLLFLIGSAHYDRKEWEAARNWLLQADLDYLNLTDQEDYSFRLGYTELQLGNLREAARLFGLLSLNSNRYRDAANFYLGYIDYSNKDYSTALNRFRQLKDHPEYREEVAFYTAQATFFDGKLEEAVRLSESFLSQYPGSDHLTEMNRVLGNSYFRLGQPSRAIPSYERYISSVAKPLRGDAYFLGLSYAGNGKQEEALTMFQQAVGEADALTQNAQLQLGQTYLALNQKQE
ncbi:MAG TPA: tetratricopeptide repeat protein, partial [Proteiniphilum sp.]|nr:tetratricopeptide repeat protein [Proteiniphilum sp.]